MITSLNKNRKYSQELLPFILKQFKQNHTTTKNNKTTHIPRHLNFNNCDL